MSMAWVALCSWAIVVGTNGGRVLECAPVSEHSHRVVALEPLLCTFSSNDEVDTEGDWWEVDFGDGGVSRGNTSSAERIVHTFAASGTFAVRGIVSKGGLEESVSLDLVVGEPTDDCIEFEVVGRSNVFQANSRGELLFTARYLRKPGLDEHLSGRLTEELVALGEAPKVYISGELDLSVAYIAQIDPLAERILPGESIAHRAVVNAQGDQWSVIVETRNWFGTAWFTIESLTKTSLNGVCGIRKTMIPIVVGQFPLTANWIVSVPPVGLQAPKLEAGFSYNLVSIAHFVCSSSTLVGLLTSESRPPMLVVTDDAFHSYATISLELNVTTGSGEPVCSTLLECDSVYIKSVYPLGPQLILLSSSQGLFALGFGENQNNKLVLSRISAVPDDINWSVDQNQHCIGEPGPASYTIMNHDTYTEGVYIVADYHLTHIRARNATSSEAQILVRNLDDVIKPFRSADRLLKSVLANAPTNQHIMLFTQHAFKEAFIAMACTDIGGNCSGSVESTEPTLGFVFPSSRQVNGICSHGTGIALFAYGDGLWLSFDGGKFFELIAELDADEKVVECPLSGETLPVFFVSTTKRRLFYGKLNTPGLAMLHGQRPSNSVFTLSATSQPSWLRYESGNLESMYIPLRGHVDSYHFIVDGPIAISNIYGPRIGIKGTGFRFGPEHEGFLLMPLEILIVDVDVSTNIAYGNYIKEHRLTYANYVMQEYSNCSLILQKGNSECASNMNYSLSNCELSTLETGLTVHVPSTGSSFQGTGVSLVVNDDSTMSCVLGAFDRSLETLTTVSINSRRWQALDMRQNWLTLPSCQIGRMDLDTPLYSPVVRLLDKLDVFQVKSTVSGIFSDYNRAIEVGENLIWSTYKAPSVTLLSNNPYITFTDIQEYEGVDRYSILTSMRESHVYERVFPESHASRTIGGVGNSTKVGSRNVLLSVRPTGTSLGMASLFIGRNEMSLSCLAEHSAAIARVAVYCPKQKSFRYETRSTSVIELPVNYRPPSNKGKAIPLTPNVYNADPSQPLYMNWYERSRKTAQYKQCGGAESKSDCACTTEMQTSKLPADTDCTTHVQTTFFSEHFVPTFVFKDDTDQTITPLQSTYRLRDINGRIDFCTNASGFELSRCGDSQDIEKFAYNPMKNDAIVFVGEGLYHFEVTIPDPVSFCELKTYIAIFVIEPPLTTRTESITISLTLIVSMFCGLAVYMVYSNWKNPHTQKYNFD